MKNNNGSKCLPCSYKPRVLVIPPIEVQLRSGFQSPCDWNPLTVIVLEQCSVFSGRVVFLPIVFFPFLY